MDGGGRRSLRGYSSPVVTDYGTLAEMTADGGLLLAQAGFENGLTIAQAASVPLVGVDGPGGGPASASAGPAELGGQEVLGAADSGGPDAPAGPGDNGAVTGESGDGGNSGGGGNASGGGGAGGGGSLPFTGFLPATVAAVGGALSAAGLAVRRRLRRRLRG